MEAAAGWRRLYAGLAELTPEQRALVARRLGRLPRTGVTAPDAADEVLPRADRHLPVPASLMQQRLWLLDRMEPGNPFYNLPLLCFELTGHLRPAVLAACFAALAARHESLRTTFAEVLGDPVQVVAPPRRGWSLPEIDLAGLPPGRGEAAGQAVAHGEARRTFDLARGPLCRTLLVRLGDRRHLLLVAIHHIIADAWSIGVLYRELGLLYTAFAAGRVSPLAPLPVQYPDFALWQRRRLTDERLATELAFWRAQLAGAPEQLQLPLDRPRPPRRGFRGRRIALAVPPALPPALHQLGERHGASLFMVLLAGYAALLARYSGQDDVVIASPVASRNQLAIEGLIGFFVNTVLHRVRGAVEQPFAGLLTAVRGVVLEVYEHQELPFDRLVSELNPRRDPSIGPLYQAALALQNTPTPDLVLGDLAIAAHGVDAGTCHTDLVLFVGMERGRLGDMQLEWNTDLFDAATVRRLAGHLLALLAAGSAAPGEPVAALPLLAPAERHQLLREHQPAAAAAPLLLLPRDPGRAACLHHRFAELAAAAPRAVAAAFEGATLTYGELERRANQLAHRLRRLGVGPEVRVGLCAERGFDQVVGMLGTLKAGGAYVPLDPAWPPERLRLLLADSGAAVVVGTEPLLAKLVAAPRRQVLLDRDRPALAGESVAPPADGGVGPDNLAYVIFTSGSTGRPKGAAVTHRNVLRLFSALPGPLGLGPDDVVTVFHSYAFDFSVWELWGALLHGGRAVLLPRRVTRSPGSLLDILERERVTVCGQTPRAFAELLPALVAGAAARRLALRTVVLAGEALAPAALAPWFAHHDGAGAPRLFNLYGITETTVYVTWREIAAADTLSGASPIGVPLADLDLHLVDRSLGLVPLGVPGELVIGGAGLCRGYLESPDRTALRFVPDPFSGRPGARLYRSGDLGRRLPAGGIEYLGRLDHQVKIRGLRIELGEIEAALRAHPAVRECAVLARELTPGDLALVAYLAAAAPAPTAAELRAFLLARLPDYMVPAAFVALAALPLSANGKLDRDALPAPARSPAAGAGFRAPRTPWEELVAELWRELLGVPAVGAGDDFFELGGHSLLASRMAAQLCQRLRRAVSVQLIFHHPVLADLAAAVEQATAQEPRLEVPALVAVPRRRARESVAAGGTGRGEGDDDVRALRHP